MRMDSEMIGILLSDSMHYTIVVSLEMSDEPYLLLPLDISYNFFKQELLLTNRMCHFLQFITQIKSLIGNLFSSE